ncbi:hypothetical protein LSH36_9g02032 [Paralvinella palmiformis]|uniref:Uncharacterized protein n=1 Tax=Paralvinella palmiformis TaxID=53620 RepID=A0AAD9KDU6_9ANNE|nr:hypothetical protein LSH36_9g02032 [Paralvinella palmiformis]
MYVLNAVILGIISIIIINKGIVYGEEYFFHQHCYYEGRYCSIKNISCSNNNVLDIEWSRVGYSQYWEQPPYTNCSATQDTCYEETEEPTKNCTGLSICHLDTCSNITWHVNNCTTPYAANFMQINYTCSPAPEDINGSYQYHHCYQEGGRCDKKYISCQEGYVLNIESARIGYSDYWYLDPSRTNCSVTNETCYEEIEEPANNCTGLRVCGLDTCSESTRQRIDCLGFEATNYMQIYYTCVPAPEDINGSYQYHHCYQEGGRCDKKYISCQEGYVLNIESARIGYSDYWYLDATRTNCSVTNETCYEEIEEPANNCTGLRVCGLDTCSESTRQRIDCLGFEATNYMQIYYTCVPAPEDINGSYQYHHCYQEGGRCDKKYISCQEGYVLNIESARIGYSDYWYLDATRTNCSVTNETCYEEIEEPANNCTGLRVCGLDTCSESTHQRIDCLGLEATNYMQIYYICVPEYAEPPNNYSLTTKLTTSSTGSSTITRLTTQDNSPSSTAKSALTHTESSTTAARRFNLIHSDDDDDDDGGGGGGGGE